MRPILITGCARSRTSQVAGVVSLGGAFGGTMYGAARGNELGFFENARIRDGVVKPLLAEMDSDPLGVRALPDADAREYPMTAEELRVCVLTALRSDGLEQGQRWFYKGAKMVYLWRLWHAAFPEAQWVIVRRPASEIVSSCLRTPFMNQHSGERAFWEAWVADTEARIEAMKRVVDHIEIWPPHGLPEMVDELGLEWTESTDTFLRHPRRTSGTTVTPHNVLPDEERRGHVESALLRGLPSIIRRHGPRERKQALIVGGGPSLTETVGDLSRTAGSVWALNGAHDWLLEQGITPAYHVVMDPRPDNALMFLGNPQRGCRYMIASQCAPEVFDALAGYDVTVWHLDQELERQMLPDDELLVPGGSTVLTRAMWLAALQDYGAFRLYGCDSSYSGDQHHAYTQALRKSSIEQVREVTRSGQTFTAARWMIAQVEEFQIMAETLPDLRDHCQVIGGGLLAAALDEVRDRRDTRKVA